MANSVTNIDQILSSQSAKETVANAVLDAESPASFGGRHASQCNALTWAYYGGTYVKTGLVQQFANGTITLGASTTTYIEYNPATNAVVSNTSGFTSGRVPLYSVITGTASVTSYTDSRGISWQTF